MSLSDPSSSAAGAMPMGLPPSQPVALIPTAVAAPPPVTWAVASSTNIGRRQSNQDQPILVPIKDGAVLMGVADGMGGYAGGEQASFIVREEMERIATYAAASNPQQLPLLVPGGFLAAQQRIQTEATANPTIGAMGSTLTCAAINGDRFVVFNIGDSRLYQYRGGHISQLTLDHNLATDLERAGTPMVPGTPEDAEQGHALTRVLRAHASGDPEIFPAAAAAALAAHNPMASGASFPAVPGDILLAASDGLHGSVSAEGIAYVLQREPNLPVALTQLVDMALKNGATDNITLVAARCDLPGSKTSNGLPRPVAAAAPAIAASAPPTAKIASRNHLMIGAGALGTVGIMVLAAPFVLKNSKPSTPPVTATHSKSGTNAETPEAVGAVPGINKSPAKVATPEPQSSPSETRTSESKNGQSDNQKQRSSGGSGGKGDRSGPLTNGVRKGTRLFNQAKAGANQVAGELAGGSKSSPPKGKMDKGKGKQGGKGKPTPIPAKVVPTPASHKGHGQG